MMTANDDPLDVLRNMGLTYSRSRPPLTAAYMIAVVNSVIGGSAVSLAIAARGIRRSGFRWQLAAWQRSCLSAYLMYRFEMARFQRLGGFQDVLFPSPEQRLLVAKLAAGPTFSVGLA